MKRLQGRKRRLSRRRWYKCVLVVVSLSANSPFPRLSGVRRVADEEHLAKLREGVSEWNGWRQLNQDLRPDLTQAELRGCTLFTDEDLVHLRRVNLNNANLKKADLSGADLREAQLMYADVSEANLRGANLSSADLRGTNFSNADLRGADLRKASMGAVILQGSDLRGAKFSSKTNLEGAVVSGAKIDRYSLECLENYGGLTLGDRMYMEIEDGVALLRASYSGFLQWLHLFALATFLFPYAWFVTVQWSKARFLATPDDTWIPLWRALGLFIFNGGVDWQSGPNMHWSFVAFLFLLTYNILRGVLLWKTKSLELQQVSTGQPARFSLSKNSWSWPWGTLFQFARWGFYINLTVVILNTGHFLTQKVPIAFG